MNEKRAVHRVTDDNAAAASNADPATRADLKKIWEDVGKDSPAQPQKGLALKPMDES